MLDFAAMSTINTDTARKGLYLHVANAFGRDKLSINGRMLWVHNNLDAIMAGEFDEGTAPIDAYDGLHVGVNIATGDVDGDGTNETITAVAYNGTSHVQTLFRDSAGVITKEVQPGFWAFGDSYKGGVTATMIDWDGDNEAEYVLGTRAGDVATYRVMEWDGTTSTILQETRPFGDTFMGGVSLGSGNYIATATSS